MSPFPPLRPDQFTPARQVRFLDALAALGSVRAACGAVGVSPECVYRLRRRDAAFARGWAAALVLAREAAGDELASRALHGVDEPIFYRGEQVGSRRRFDARLLLAHVARLDAMRLDPQARGDAARFDELLATVAGERPDQDMYEFAEIDETAGEVIGGGEPLLPMPRGVYTTYRAHHADVESRGWGVGTACDEEEDGAEDAYAGLEPEEAHAMATAEWDTWFAHACTTVDTLLTGETTAADAEPPIEVKSMAGPGSSPFTARGTMRGMVEAGCLSRDAARVPQRSAPALRPPADPLRPPLRACQLPIHGEDFVWRRTVSTVSTDANACVARHPGRNAAQAASSLPLRMRRCPTV